MMNAEIVPQAQADSITVSVIFTVRLPLELPPRVAPWVQVVESDERRPRPTNSSSIRSGQG